MLYVDFLDKNMFADDCSRSWNPNMEMSLNFA